MKEARSPPAGYVTAGAFGHPTFLYELLGYYGNGASLKTRVTSQIRPGDRLMSSDQIEHYPTVDITRRLTRRNLKVTEIYLAHFNNGRLRIRARLYRAGGSMKK